MKILLSIIVAFAFHIECCFGQESDSFIDSLFYANMASLQNKCKDVAYFRINNENDYDFLYLFASISGSNVLIYYNCFDLRTNKKALKLLYKWYNKNHEAINEVLNRKRFNNLYNIYLDTRPPFKDIEDMEYRFEREDSCIEAIKSEIKKYGHHTGIHL